MKTYTYDSLIIPYNSITMLLLTLYVTQVYIICNGSVKPHSLINDAVKPLVLNPTRSNRVCSIKDAIQFILIAPVWSVKSHSKSFFYSNFMKPQNLMWQRVRRSSLGWLKERTAIHAALDEAVTSSIYSLYSCAYKSSDGS